MDRRSKIIEIICKVSGKNLTPDPEESLFDSGMLDSFALPDVVGALEKEFGVKIPDSDLHPRKFESVARIEDYLESHA